MIKLLGILGGLFFSYCGVPAAWATFKAKRSVGVPIGTAWMIVLGGICMYSYMTLSYGLDWILTINYAVEVASWAVIVWYHYFPKKMLGETAQDLVKSLEVGSYHDPKITGAALQVETLPERFFGTEEASAADLPKLGLNDPLSRLATPTGSIRTTNFRCTRCGQYLNEIAGVPGAWCPDQSCMPGRGKCSLAGLKGFNGKVNEGCDCTDEEWCMACPCHEGIVGR